MTRRHTGALALLTLAALLPPAWGSPARERLERPLVTGRRGVVTSLHPLSSMAGMRILMKGGNAFDAAVATAAATTVVDPKNSTIGGQGFATVYVAKARQVRALNFYGTAPRTATIELLKDKAYKTGYLSTPVPSNLKGYQALLKARGTMSWAEVLEPAIELAEDGFVLTEEFTGILQRLEDRLNYPSSRRVFFPGGRAPRPGEVFRQPDLARTLRRIAKEGPDVFYKGDIARGIAEFYQRHGGLLTYDDLAAYEARWVEPISTTYRGYTVYTQPPNSSGIALLLQLNLLEGFDLKAAGHNSPEYLHLIGEVQRLAIADRNRYVADPDFVSVPIARLLSKEYARERRRLITPGRTLPAVPAPQAPAATHDEANTTHLTVADGEGNMVSLTQTLGSWYGSGVVAADTGVLFSNQMRHLHTEPESPSKGRAGAAPALQPVAGHRPQGRRAGNGHRDPGGRRHLAAVGPGPGERLRLRHGRAGRRLRAADDLRRLPGDGHRGAPDLRGGGPHPREDPRRPPGHGLHRRGHPLRRGQRQRRGARSGDRLRLRGGRPAAPGPGGLVVGPDGLGLRHRLVGS